MWSVGCILGEMLLGRAIFPGTSTMNQVELITEVLGKPTDEDIESIQAPLASHIFENINLNKKKNLKNSFQGVDDHTIDFIK